MNSTTRLSAATLGAGFVAMTRRVETFDLLRDPRAFTLLAYIALRARWSDSTALGLARGQMVLGRHSAARELGMKQGAIREATKRLISANAIATRATKRGTVVTLLSNSIFDLGAGGPATSGATNNTTPAQPTDNQPAATNEDCKNGKNGESGATTPTDDELRLRFPGIDIAAERAACAKKKPRAGERYFVDHWLPKAERPLAGGATTKSSGLPEPRDWQEFAKNFYQAGCTVWKSSWAELDREQQRAISAAMKEHTNHRSSRITSLTAGETSRTDF